eukprot:456184-Pelagomonas_calceolata.AAC.2
MAPSREEAHSNLMMTVTDSRIRVWEAHSKLMVAALAVTKVKRGQSGQFSADGLGSEGRKAAVLAWTEAEVRGKKSGCPGVHRSRDEKGDVAVQARTDERVIRKKRCSPSSQR